MNKQWRCWAPVKKATSPSGCAAFGFPPWFNGSNLNALPQGVSLRPLTGFILVRRGLSSQMQFFPPHAGILHLLLLPSSPTVTLPQDTTCLRSVTAGGVRGLQPLRSRTQKLLVPPACSDGFASRFAHLGCFVPNWIHESFFLQPVDNHLVLVFARHCPLCVCVCFDLQSLYVVLPHGH